MNIIDYTSSYIKYIDDLDLDEYKSVNPYFFKHYFEYWGYEKEYSVSINKEEVIKNKERIISRLPAIEEKFKSFGFDLAKLDIILFVGQNLTNGHSFKNEKGNFVVFVPIEAYSSNMQIDIFITHEIVHALHYSLVQEFYFKNKKEKENIYRLFITEGIATFISKKTMGLSELDSIWADYLSEDEKNSWADECKSKEEELKNYILNDPDVNLIFYTSNVNEPIKYRGGYYFALRLVEKFVEEENISIKELIQMKRNNLEKWFKREIGL